MKTKKQYQFRVYRNDGRWTQDYDSLRQARLAVKDLVDDSKPFRYGIQKLGFVPDKENGNPVEVSRRTIQFA